MRDRGTIWNRLSALLASALTATSILAIAPAGVPTAAAAPGNATFVETDNFNGTSGNSSRNVYVGWVEEGENIDPSSGQITVRSSEGDLQFDNADSGRAIYRDFTLAGGSNPVEIQFDVSDS